MKISKLLLILLILALMEIVILYLENKDQPETPVKSSITVTFFYNNPRLTLNPKLCNDVFPVTRNVTAKLGDVPAEMAIEQLMKGPNDEEQKTGYHSPFTEKTTEMLNIITQKNDTVSVDFKDFRHILKDVNSPCAQSELMAQLSSTVSEYYPGKFIVFSINGDAAKFYEWLQTEPPTYLDVPE